MRFPSFLRLAVLVAALSGGAARAEEPETPAAPPRRRLTLPELIQLARTRSPMVASARSQIAIRQMQRREAKWMWFPTGDATFALTFSPRVTCIGPSATQLADGVNPGPTQKSLAALAAEPADYRAQNCVNTIDPTTLRRTGPQPNIFGTTIDGTAGDVSARLVQPLFTFGKIEYGTKAADAGIAAEEARTEGARGDAEVSVARAYWGLKASRTGLVTAGDVRSQLVEWIERAETDMEAEKPKYGYGQIDVQRMKVALTQADIVIADLERNGAIAENGLRIAVGAEVDVDEEELDVQEVIEQPLSYYQREALLHRPEVRALDAGSRAYRYLQRLQLSQILPNLGISGSVGYRWAHGVDEGASAYLNHANALYYYVGVGAQMPLDLFERTAHYQRAGAEADAFDAQRRLALSGIAFEIVQGWANLNEARRRLKALDRAQHVAQGWLSSIEQRMELGVGDAAGTVRDYVEATRIYIDARLRYYQSINDVNIGIAVLHRATGVEVAR